MELRYAKRLTPVWMALLVLILAACQPVLPAASTEAPSPDLATYTDAGGLFTVQHPAGWVVDATSFPDMPMPYVALGSNQEILDASTAWQPLPEDQIGVAVMLVPRALFAEAGITDDMPLEDALPLIVTAMSADDPQAPEDAFASTAEALTLANGLPAIRMEGEATTEAYLMTAADLGDGLLLIAPRIQAVGVHNEALEAQVDAVINSFELTASAGDVMGHVMDNLAQMEAQAVAGDMAGAPAPTVAFTATDFAFEGPAEIQGGLTRIELTNAGEHEHGLWLVRLDEGKTLEDFLGVMAEIDGATEIPDWFAFDGGVTAEPGATVA